MRRFGLIWWTYAFAITPLLVGSAIFFYWFYTRRWYAIDTHIEYPAFLAILLFFLFGSIVLVLSAVHCIRERTLWDGAIGPLCILAVTLVAIDLYGAMHDRLSEWVYLRIDTQGSNVTEVNIWSAHFEQGFRTNPDEHDLIFNYGPTYTYDWGMRGSSGTYYTVDSVFVEVHSMGQVRTYVMPELGKGQCASITLKDIAQFPLAKNRTSVERGD